MNTLIVYDTQYGNTEQIARAIAESRGPEWAARVEKVTNITNGDLTGVDLLVLGCPTQAWQMTPATKALLTRLARLAHESLRGVAVACFDTRLNKPRLVTGSAARRMSAQMRKLEAQLIAPLESFLVSGREGPLVEHELERAAEWARDISHTLLAKRRMAEITATA